MKERLPFLLSTLLRPRTGALLLLLSLALIGTGCKTAANGSRVVDVVKLDQARALVTPIAASGIRRALLNSPEHAPEIARYAASFAGVFCTMSLSNEFRPEFLITEVDKFADPELAKVGDGYLIDIKNSAIGLYKVFYGDRFRAEVPADQWLHQVCAFFCEAVSQGLTDAGYPGGVRKSASIADWGLRIADSGEAFKHAGREGMRVGDLSLNTPPASEGVQGSWFKVQGWTTEVRTVPFPSPLPSPQGEGIASAGLVEQSAIGNRQFAISYVAAGGE